MLAFVMRRIFYECGSCNPVGKRLCPEIWLKLILPLLVSPLLINQWEKALCLALNEAPPLLGQWPLDWLGEKSMNDYWLKAKMSDPVNQISTVSCRTIF